MELLLARHLWGISEDWEAAFPRIKAAGYGAIETSVPARGDQVRFRELLAQYELKYIAMVFTSGANVAEHVHSFESQVEQSLALNPILINSHSGRDAWDESQIHDFFQAVLKIEAHTPVAVGHETHRGRILFNPWVTRSLLAHFEGLHLVCDLSHWVCVCERLIDSELDIIKAAARRCVHLHTRVGYEQGPQVPDPRAPEFSHHLEAHERWWDMIWDAQQAMGLKTSFLTPEFGPPDYMHTLPFTRQPVADLWEICNWMAERQAKRFARRM